MSTWREFWNTENSVYVSPKHMSAHFSAVASDILALLPEKRPLVLLDWGCGEALGAGLFAEAGVLPMLYDPVPLMQEKLRRRYGGRDSMRILTDDDARRIPEHSVDAILINSVLQYVSKDDFARLLPRLHHYLKPDGVLILADVVSVKTGMAEDILYLIKAGAENGFLSDVIIGLFKTLFSRYRSVRRENGFTSYDETELVTMLDFHGYRAERRRNAGFAPHRMLFLAFPKKTT